ncbi:TonB-dependent receptor [Algoriphagus lutimaris]|uniref:outer membrane beta-barrel family protein n=1 Tax=Algoriphagus lutimaris TaxID=613197 RepID=UPI00196A38D2|nr:outer membrane beta-barrel family protein [Algoriphagus lutimaris]MBN3518952.1 TonB-dependent receptor [Algoriphagus lutimaris]
MSRLDLPCFIVFLNLFFGSFVSFAQSSISGIVHDAKTNIPLEYSSISIFSATDSSLIDGSISDVGGLFQLEKLKPGSYFLKVSFIGYQTKESLIFNLAKNENRNFGIISLEPDETTLEGIEVKGQKLSTNFQLEKQSYAADNFQAAQGGTASDILKNLPGVAIDAMGTITIRGTSGFVVMLNGKPIQSDPISFLSQLPANSIEKIDWISSPSAQYDSEGKAGMINVITKSGTADGLYVQFNSRLGFPPIENYGNAERAKRYGADFNLNYLKGKWDISLGASYQRNDIAGRRVGDVYTISGDTTTRFPSQGERSIDEKNYSGRFTIGFNPNAANSFSLGFYGAVRDKLRTADILYDDNHAIVNGERIYTFQYFNANDQSRRGDVALGSLDYAHTFGNDSKISSSILYEYSMLGGPTSNLNLGYPDLSKVYQEDYNTNDNPLHGVRVNVDYSFKPLSIGQLLTGYQFRSLDHTGDFLYERKNIETGEFDVIPEFSSSVNLTRNIHAGYLQLDKKSEKYSYGFGVRVEHMDRSFDLEDQAGMIDTVYQYDFIRPFISANIGIPLSESLQFKANFSQRVERTTTFKMNPFPEREHSETLEQGDPNLLPEFINQVELGIVKTWNANSFYATAYHSRVKNLVNRVNTVYNDSILNRIYSNVGTGKSTGFDLGAELFPTEWWKLFAGLNLYYYSIEGSFDNKPVNTSSWVHSFSINTTFTLQKNWSIQGNLNYLSKRVTAQGVDSRFYLPSINIKKTWLDNRLSANLIWQNIDMGLLKTNEQRITTFRPGEFYTTTNYIQEVDMLILNLSYTLNRSKNKAKFVKSEFGEKEF